MLRRQHRPFALAAVVLFVFAALIGCVSCAASLGPMYKEPPCGYRGHSCGNGFCCADTDDCGQTEHPGCPANSCCYRGDGLAGQSLPIPQYPAKANR